MVGTVAALGYMYVAGKQTKREEGPASIYSEFSSSLLFHDHSDPVDADQSKGLQSRTSDARLDSSGVRETVSGDRKP